MIQFDAEKSIVRFDQMKPRASVMRERDPGIPVEFFEETQTTLQNFTYMAPRMPNNSHISSTAAIVGGDAGDAVLVSVAICYADKGPPLHNHLRTTESFFVLKGELHVTLGAKEEEKHVLQPWDFITIPPGVMRRFRGGPGGETALLAIIQGNKDAFGDVVGSDDEAQRLIEKYGIDVLRRLIAGGMRFEGEY